MVGVLRPELGRARLCVRGIAACVVCIEVSLVRTHISIKHTSIQNRAQYLALPGVQNFHFKGQLVVLHERANAHRI